MLNFIWRNFAVEVTDAILIGPLIQLGVGGLVGFSHFALSEDFFLAIASADVDWVELGHCVDSALYFSICRNSRRGRDGRNWLSAEVAVVAKGVIIHCVRTLCDTADRVRLGVW